MKKYTYITCILLVLNLFSIESFAQKEISTWGETISIAPNNGNIRYNGQLYSIISEKQAELHRYSKDYLTNGMDGTINLSKARTQPGISISFKTNSPLVQLKFAELENSSIRKKEIYSV